VSGGIGGLRRASCVVGVATACAALPTAAQSLHFVIEPAVVGVERLDDLYAGGGLEARTAARLGAGAAIGFGERWSLGFGLGVAAGTADFGLLDGTTARLVRTDAYAELRGRVPGRWRGIGMQLVAGGGRLALRYHPEHVAVNVEGATYDVDLEPIDRWTGHLGFEVVHALAGGEVGLRSTWRFYSMEVASPSGIDKRGARDWITGLVLRVALD